MGEWSDFFEDFPEHNPANYDNGAYAIPREQYPHKQEISKSRIDERIATAHSKRTTEPCSPCKLIHIKTYKVTENISLSECSVCGKSYKDKSS